MGSLVSTNERLAYEISGTGPAVVFLHGLTFNRASWRPIIDRLIDRFQCIAIDLPGHGDSSGSPGSLAQVATDVRALLSELNVDRPVMVGHSMAAAIVSIFAASYPVAGVVEVDQPLDVRPFAQLVHRLAPALRGEAFSATFEPFRQSMGVEMVPEPLHSMLVASQSIRQDIIIAYWSEILGSTPEELQGRIDSALDAISVPYLAVFGRRLAVEERDHLRRHIARLELEEWPDHGHFVHIVAPDRFADRLAEFVQAAMTLGVMFPAAVTPLLDR